MRRRYRTFRSSKRRGGIECGLVSTALEAFSYEVGATKSKIEAALEGARAAKLTVNVDGSITYPLGGEKGEDDKIPEGGTVGGLTDDTASAAGRQAAPISTPPPRTGLREPGRRCVTPSQAVSALRRARKELTRRGWKVTRYEISDNWIVLSVQPPGTDDIVQVEAFPYDRLGVVAYSECARYPSGTPMTEWGDPQLPAQQAPAPLRS